jgi:hypothetical protein
MPELPERPTHRLPAEEAVKGWHHDAGIAVVAGGAATLAEPPVD